MILIKTRVGNLAFLRPNNSIFAFLFLVSPSKKCLAFWLYFGFFVERQNLSKNCQCRRHIRVNTRYFMYVLNIKLFPFFVKLKTLELKFRILEISGTKSD